jgi:hypothetical protein
MNINANVPTNSARSLEGAIRFGIVHSKDEIDTWADQVLPRSNILFGCRAVDSVRFAGWRRLAAPPAVDVGIVSDRRAGGTSKIGSSWTW